MEKLNELVAALYPQYGTPGSRDIDVTERRKVVVESAAAIDEAFRALEQRASNLNDGWLNAITERDEARAKLAELEKQDPVDFRWRWASDDSSVWTYCHMDKFKDAVAAFGDNVIIELVYSRPAPAINLADLVPKQVTIREAIAALENHEWCGTPASGYKAGVSDTIAAILRNIEEAK